MDPDANLDEQERLMLYGNARTKAETERLKDLRAALGQWLARGGYEPKWSKCPVAAYWMRRNYPMNNSNTVTKEDADRARRQFRS